MDRARVLNEIAPLADICESLEYDLDKGEVKLHGFEFPEGWTPSEGTIWFDLPETYPKSQPKVYIPERMRFKGGRPMTMLRQGPSGWSKYCIHELGDWEPKRHTLVTLTRMIVTSLNDPNTSNPVRNAA